jgi:hypothetical protein
VRLNTTNVGETDSVLGLRADPVDELDVVGIGEEGIGLEEVNGTEFFFNTSFTAELELSDKTETESSMVGRLAGDFFITIVSVSTP